MWAVLTYIGIALAAFAGGIVSVNGAAKLIAGWAKQQGCDECYKALAGMKEVVLTMEKMQKLESDKDEHIDNLKSHIKIVLKQYWQAIANYDENPPT